MEKPKIRFGKFNNKWKKNKLDKVVDFFDNQRIPIDSGERKAGPYPYYGASGIIDFVDGYIFNGEYVLLAEDGANIILRGSPIAYLTKGKFWLNNHAHIMKMKTGSNEFLIQLLEKQNYEKYNTGTAQPKLNGEVVKKITLHFPSDEEQSAIGSLFRNLDELLASYKDNLANYQSLKATMLSKMFPKAGQTVPEIRLDGFKGEWRIIKLGDVLSELKSGLSRELSNDDIGLPVIRANNISDGNLNLDRDIKYWFKDDPKGANTANYFVRENDILVNFINSETKMGTAAIVLREPDRETIYTTNILKLTVKEDYYPYFVYLMTFVQSYQNYIKAITKPSVNQASFTTVDFKKYEFLCPAFQEQQAISAYFLNFDNLINSHQEKITQIETLKKKLLQDMFI